MFSEWIKISASLKLGLNSRDTTQFNRQKDKFLPCQTSLIWFSELVWYFYGVIWLATSYQATSLATKL